MRIGFRVALTLPLALPLAFSATTAEAQQGGPALTHFSHVATGFSGAPGGRGLTVTTGHEVNAVMMHANFAAGEPGNLEAMQTHARHVLHATTPEQGSQGPGLGFGVKRAAEAVVTHIEMAANAPGASEAVRTHGANAALAGRAVAARAEEIAALARRVLAAEAAPEASPLVEQMRELALQLDTGADLNGSGRVELDAREPGMNQLEAAVYSILEGERLPRILR